MQIVTNNSATIVHLPKTYAPTGFDGPRVSIVPGASAAYDYDAFEKARPGAAHGMRTVLDVHGEALLVPAPVGVPTPAVAEPSPRGKAARTDAYAELSEPDAAELIAAETDARELRAWAKVEDRAGIKTALKARLEALKG